MRKKDLITSREAVKLFVEADLSEATFRRRVREKIIQPELEEGRQRGALYPRDQVLAAISQSTGRKAPRQEIQESLGATDWVQADDLPYLLALDYEMYGIESTVDISITHAWWIKNPYMCRILFDKKDRRNIWGAITVIPMEESTIFNLLNGTMQERQITADNILEYKDGGKYYAYIPSAVIKPEHRQSFMLLIGSMLDFWCKQYPQVQIVKFYAFAASDTGWDLMKKLFFSPRYDLGESAFELDPYKRNPSRIVRAFQQCVEQHT
jgi:hypothetical protein